MPLPWPLSAASRWPVVAGATGLLLGGAILVGGGTAAAPPAPEPSAVVRARLGAPTPGAGLEGVMRVRQSLVPDVAARAAALPGGDLRGRFWVATPDRWRVELQGRGHDWQVVGSGADLEVYDGARQRLIRIPRALLPAGLADLGPTAVGPGPPATVAGRPVHVVRYRPRGADVLLREVEVSVDRGTGLPLALRVFAAGRAAPVLDARATSAREATVTLARVTLDPPPTATTVPLGALGLAARLGGGGADAPVRVVGAGWERALVVRGGLPGGLPLEARDVGDGLSVARLPIASLVTVASPAGPPVSAIGLLPPERLIEALRT